VQLPVPVLLCKSTIDFAFVSGDFASAAAEITNNRKNIEIDTHSIVLENRANEENPNVPTFLNDRLCIIFPCRRRFLASFQAQKQTAQSTTSLYEASKTVPATTTGRCRRTRRQNSNRKRPDNEKWVVFFYGRASESLPSSSSDTNANTQRA
jgi:hypothetical protein